MIRVFVTLGFLFAAACRAAAPSGSGEALFAKHCAVCHGVEGQGRFLKGVPPNRTTTLDVTGIVERILTKKPAHRKMPNFPSLSPAQATAIAQHVMELKERSDGSGAFWTSHPSAE